MIPKPKNTYKRKHTPRKYANVVPKAAQTSPSSLQIGRPRETVRKQYWVSLIFINQLWGSSFLNMWFSIENVL
jgi:hypothetical protein